MSGIADAILKDHPGMKLGNPNDPSEHMPDMDEYMVAAEGLLHAIEQRNARSVAMAIKTLFMKCEQEENTEEPEEMPEE